MSSLDYLDLCRLCLVKDEVSVPIFEGEGDVRQIFLKITACLPVKVAREDKLPKKICKECVCKVECFYSFCNTTANSEKQLLQLLGDVQMEDDKQNYIGNVLSSNEMRADENSKNNRLEDTVMHQVGEHQSSMNIMDNIMDMPMMISGTTQQITSVPMDNTGESVQNVSVAGPSTQMAHEQVHINQNQSDTPMQQEEEEESSEEDENFEEECDADEGLPVKEESEEDPNNRRAVEPTTFVNVSLACEEAGPSGLQQQKITELPDNMVIPQTEDVDPKTGEKPIVKWTREQSKKETSVCVISIVSAPWKSDQIECSSTTSGNDGSAQCQNTELIEPIKVEPVDSELDPQNSQSVSVDIESIKIEPQDSQFATNHDFTKKKKESNVGELPQDFNSSNTLKESTEDEVMKQIKNTCPFCDKKFVDAYGVEQHVMHSHRKTYPCNICRRSYCAPKLLEEHQQRIHGPDFFLECNICHIKYKSEDGLKRHNIRAHTNVESKFTCEHCGRSYKLKADLLTHIKRIHMSQLQICRFCGKAVKDVKSHEWRHKERNGEFKYAYSCHLCRKKFLHRSRLDNHLLLHKKGFKCEKCGKEYVGSRELRSHQRSKHGQTTISTCILCHKKFTSISNFHQHVLTHAGIRPYKCDICDEDFTQRSSLLRHRKNHPGPLPPYTVPHPQIADLARCYLQKVKDDPDSVLKHARF